MEAKTPSLEQIWAVLTPPHSAAFNAIGISGPLGRPVQVAVDGRGRRSLLVPHDGEILDVPSDMPLLRVSDGEFAFETDRGRYIAVRCEDGRFVDEFATLCGDVVAAADGSREPARATLQVLGRWRRLLATLRERTLTMPQRLGLFAELTVLAVLLDTSPAPGIDCWRGPLGEPHDFLLRSDAVEVKAVGSGAQSIEIHGLGQLDRGDSARLVLLVATVEERAEGRSIRSLVDEIHGSIDDHGALDDRLLRIGWSRGDAEQRFVVTEWRAGIIDGGFPRLVPGDLVGASLRPGVRTVRYEIELVEVRALTRQVDLTSHLRGAGA